MADKDSGKGQFSQCLVCRHARSRIVEGGSELYCAAYPDGIPAEIFYNQILHNQPVEGDHGIQWELNERLTPNAVWQIQDGEFNFRPLPIV